MATSQEVEQKAAELLAAAGLNSAPIDVAAAAAAASTVVTYQPLKSELSGVLVKEPDRVIIGVNSLQSKTRQRFTVAHELGHLRLQHSGEVFVDHMVLRRDRASSQGVDPQEIDANRFAAALLMPQGLVLERLSSIQAATPSLSSQKLIDALAKDFEVSPEAMSYRLASLGVFMPT